MYQTNKMQNIKPQPNHQIYLQTLQKMTPTERLQKAFELSEMTKQLFLQGIKKRFPDYSAEKTMEIYLKRISLCYNRNW
jgi:hypothetical protein